MNGPDEWSSKQFVPWQQAHAVGLLALYVSFQDTSLRSILIKLRGLTYAVGMRKLRSQTISNVINLIRKCLVNTDVKLEPENSLVYALECSGICIENRNIFMHGWTNYSADAIHKENIKGAPEFSVYPFDVALLRQAVDESWSTARYLFYLGLAFSARGDPHWHQPIPDRPSLPRRIMPIDGYGPEALMPAKR